MERLLGIITDGDLRRMMQKRKENVLGSYGGRLHDEKSGHAPAHGARRRALRLMEEKKITSVLVVDADGKLEGVLHVHDLWTLQLF